MRTAASANDPWSLSHSAAPSSALSGLGASPLSDLDGFELLTNRAQKAASPLGGARNGATSPFDMSAMEGSLSPPSTGAIPKKSPESFLGPNSGLVNLENLVKSNHDVITTAFDIFEFLLS